MAPTGAAGLICLAWQESGVYSASTPAETRQANHALWRIVFTRLGSDPATRAYVERRTSEGKSKAEITRCLKRSVAREVYPHLRPAR